ncbi:MAG: hypothetical protein P1U58_15325 [Verrucomicrobiales bacterium]|nr:hypothetical protein [Verrucomicrobiales bacterium]
MKLIATALLSVFFVSGNTAASEARQIEKIIDGLTTDCTIDEKRDERREAVRIALTRNFESPEQVIWRYIDAIVDGSIEPTILRPVEDSFESLRLGFETEVSVDKSREIIRSLARETKDIHEFPPGISAYEDPDPEAVGFGFGLALTKEGQKILREHYQRNQLIIESIRTLNAANLRQDDALIESLATANHSQIEVLVASRIEQKTGANKPSHSSPDRTESK